MESLVLASIGGFSVGAFTVVGSLAGFFGARTGRSTSLISFDFALGMMVAAAGLSMIGPSIMQIAGEGLHQKLGFAASLLAGFAFIQILSGVLEKRMPGNHAWLFVIAMCLHNIPEGVAAGAGLAELQISQALSLLGAIGLQNLPEGLLCFVAFSALGFGSRRALAAAAATGFFEFAGGVGAGVAVQFFQSLTPYLLAFAGSAMLAVCVRELRERSLKFESSKALIWSHVLTGFLAVALLNQLL